MKLKWSPTMLLVGWPIFQSVPAAYVKLRLVAHLGNYALEGGRRDLQLSLNVRSRHGPAA